MKHPFSLCLSTLFLAVACLSHAQEVPRVELFSPQGTVKGVRQVTARFSEPLTSFGDPRNDSPFDVSCPEKGSGRWADVNNWVFDFDRDLPAGVVCSFTLRNGVKAFSGAAVGGPASFSFSTGGPAVVSSHPRKGWTIAEDQIFVLNLDGEADEASILANARFGVEGIAEQLGVAIVKGAERAALLRASGLRDDNKTVAIRCRQNFPSAAKVKLIWGAGIGSTSGVMNGKDQILNFTVREPFSISFSCERVNANAPCLPVTPMQLSFSAPVPLAQAKKIVMKSGKKVYKPAFEPESDEGEDSIKNSGAVRGVAFKGPFPEKKSFVIELPRNLADDAGRRPVNLSKFPLQVATDSFTPLAKFAAPFGIVELNADATVPVTLRSVEPQLKARKLNPEEPKKYLDVTVKTAVASAIDKARAVGDKLSAWITGAKKPERPAAGIMGKSHVVSNDREVTIIEWLRKVRRAQRGKPLLSREVGAEEFVIPKPNGEKAFEVVGIPMHKAGFHIVEVESPLLGAALLDKPRPMYVSSAALVTNMSAHLKIGRESSLVWVTSLDKALPVAGAEVHIRDCNGKLYWQGKTDVDGVARVKTRLPENLPYCSDSQTKDKESEEDYFADNDQPMLGGMSGGLFVFARKQGDLTLVHSSWNKGIENWRFQLPSDDAKEHTFAHTVFDRTLLRAGDTVHMKHFMRNHVMNGFDLRKVAELPKAVVVEHRGSEQRYQFPLVWRADNSAETTMALPKGAALGFYDVYLSKPPAGKSKKGSGRKEAQGEEEYSTGDAWLSGSFRVEEFRIPLMKGVVEAPKEPSVNASSIELDLYVSHLSGGGAGGAPVKLRTQIKPRAVNFDDYEGYTFGNGKVETGVVREESSQRSDQEEEEGGADEVQPKAPTYGTREFVLDKTGAFRAKIDGLPKIDAPHTMIAELEFYDPNGELQTVTGRVPLWSSKLFVGIKPDSWASTPDTLNFKAVAVDLKGRPVPGTKVQVELLQRQHFSHRKRLVGGFYSYEQVTETKSLGPICQGTTDSLGLLACSAKSPVSGNVILQASVTDDAGNGSTANQDVWVAGKDEWWFEAGDSDRIDLLPEKKFYNAGETAKFQVRSPFRSATVLVTVEREGIIDAYVKKITGKQPMVSVPVKGKYAPNVFVSAFCVRGRVAGSKPTALFDPGKPAYRLGIGEIRVSRQEHELKVKVISDSDTYKVRGKAKIRVRVTRAVGGALPKGAEVAIAAVDEGLLELMPNDSWKLLDAMMGRRGYEVETSTAQTQVVGRRHYGLKALPAGGGGGMRSTRELFDAVLAWKGRVKLDAKGEATLEIPLNDSLTSFSVVAIASAGSGLFGTGRATIRTSQDLMVLAGLPPLVRQGDRFTARFTARNASARAMTVTVAAKPSWSDGSGFQPVTLQLSPGEAKDVSWPAEVPAGIESATWEARIQEENGEGADHVKVSQKVIPAVPVHVHQATITQVEKDFGFDVRMPEDALKGRGGVNVVTRAKLADGLGGVVDYLKSYPYSCLEQMTSRAIGLKDDALWKQVVTVLPSYLDGNGLAKYFPSQFLEGSPMLTAYILSISKAAGRELPDDLVQKMEQGLVAFVEGRIRTDSGFRRADLSIQKLAALEALSRRREVDAKMLSSIAIEPNLWPTSAVLDWVNILKQSEHLPKRSERLTEAERIIRSRLNFQGTVMSFSTDRSDRLWWLMVSTDTNALRALLTFMNEPGWRPDVPRLVRGALARQSHGSWETTIANAWGVVTLDQFSRSFEAVPVAGVTSAELAGVTKTVDWNIDKKGKTLSFPWPEGSARLSLHHPGGGKPWATVMSLAAIPLKEPISSGYHIKKTVTPVEQRDKNRLSRGDVARVRLEIEAQSDMTWVAVNDPVPAGATILGSGLGRDSALMVEGERKRSWPVYEERAFEAYRAYYDYVPKGKFVTEYTVRFNNEGSFRLPPSRVEALYAPEMYGETPNRSIKVGE